METSLFIAKIFGLSYLVICGAFLLNPKAFNRIMEDFGKDAAVTYLMALVTLVVGIVIVIVHNVWVANWTVIITIFGYLAIVKGIWLLAFPGSVSKFMEGYLKYKRLRVIHLLVGVIVGVLLTYLGFIG